MINISTDYTLDDIEELLKADKSKKIVINNVRRCSGCERRFILHQFRGNFDDFVTVRNKLSYNKVYCDEDMPENEFEVISDLTVCDDCAYYGQRHGYY